VILIVSACVSLVSAQTRGPGPKPDPAIRVRDGFMLSIALADIDRARFPAFDAQGTLFVSQPDSGQIPACRDENDDGYYETTVVFVKDHPPVQGMFWHEGWLWFTESGAIFRGRDATGDGVADAQQPVIPDGQLPKGGHEWPSSLIHQDDEGFDYRSRSSELIE
jgi:hypothetical protein